jgi:phosphatidylinositol alpha-1,6-mannosyltransferase
MKIFLIATDVFFKGGVQRYTRYQYKALQELFGEENIYLYSLKDKMDNVSFEEDIKVNYIEKKKGLIGKLNFTLKVLNDIKKLHPDLIIINHINLLPIGLFVKKLFKIPYFLDVYGLEIWSGINKLKLVSLRQSDKIIGDCNFILNYIYTNFDIDKGKLNLLYDPVDINKFKPLDKDTQLMNKYNIPINKFVILTVGRLDRFKGHKLVINALKYLPEDIIYLIVGGGKEEKILKDLVKENKVEGRVIFTGRVPESDLVDFYNVCDVFVLISKFDKNEGEGLPLTPIEAAACRKPIIVGNEDGSKEACINGVNGFHVSSNDLSSLIDKLLFFYNNKEMALKMGINGRKMVEGNFSYDIFKNKLKEIIDDSI